MSYLSGALSGVSLVDCLVLAVSSLASRSSTEALKGRQQGIGQANTTAPLPVLQSVVPRLEDQRNLARLSFDKRIPGVTGIEGNRVVHKGSAYTFL